MIGREGTLAVLDDAVRVEHGAHIVFIEHFDPVDFVRSADSIEEMDKWNSRLKRCGMGSPPPPDID